MIYLIDTNKIKIIKNSMQVIICYEGKKLILPIDEFKDMSKEEIKEWYLKEFGGI